MYICIPNVQTIRNGNDFAFSTTFDECMQFMIDDLLSTKSSFTTSRIEIQNYEYWIIDMYTRSAILKLRFTSCQRWYWVHSTLQFWPSINAFSIGNTTHIDEVHHDINSLGQSEEHCSSQSQLKRSPRSIPFHFIPMSFQVLYLWLFVTVTVYVKCECCIWLWILIELPPRDCVTTISEIFIGVNI